jgi:hypothetical protein
MTIQLIGVGPIAGTKHFSYLVYEPVGVVGQIIPWYALHRHLQHIFLLQIAKMLTASNFGSLRNLVSNKTKFLRNNIIQ